MKRFWMFLVVAALVATPVAHAAPTKCNPSNPCQLVFLSQPKDAQVGTPITTTDFSTGTPSGIQVQIQFVSGGVAFGNAGDQIALTPQPASTNTAKCTPSPSCLVASGSPVAADSNATATFTNFAISFHGRYTLQASDTARNVAAGTSDGFNIWDNAHACGPGCQNPLNGPNESGTVTTTNNTGGILASTLGAYNRDTFLSATCNSSSYTSTFPKNFTPAYGPNVGDIELFNGSGTKTVTVTYDKTFVHKQGLASSSYNICFEATSPFPDFQNNTSPQEGNSGIYFGLLPGPCGSTATPFSQANPVGGSTSPPFTQPCLTTNPSGSAGAVTVQFTLPDGDKWCG